MKTPIKINGKIYYAEDLKDQVTLFAAKRLTIHRWPFDGSQPIDVISQGNPIGVFTSFINPKEGRNKNQWFQFTDNYSNGYYTENIPGNFSLTPIDQQIRDNQPKNQDAISRVGTIITGTVVTWGAIKLITALIKR